MEHNREQTKYILNTSTYVTHSCVKPAIIMCLTTVQIESKRQET